MVVFRSIQPVMFHHSSRGLGHDSNKQFAFVYTKALLVEHAFEKAERNLLENIFRFCFA